jgi:hypothetical protein
MMFRSGFLRIAGFVVAALLLVPAIASFTVGGQIGSQGCRRMCWVYEIAARLLGGESANILAGMVWLALSAGFFWISVRNSNVR